MRNLNELSPSQKVGIIAMLPAAGIIYYFITNPGLFEKLAIIVRYNFGFWFLSAAGIGYALYRKYKKPNEFTWLELPFQVIGTTVTLFLLYSFFFYTTTELRDREVWNSYTRAAEYYEEWTEEVCEDVCDSRDDDGNCTSSHEECHDVYHPPEWYILTVAEEKIPTSEAVYRNYVLRFGNEREVDLHRSNQTSYGDGDKYVTLFTGGFDQRVPTANEHEFVNYLKGSESIKRRRSSNETGYEKWLKPYPKVYASHFGKIELNRVVNAGANLNTSWVEEVDHGLDMALTDLGSIKQVNVLVYVANTADQALLHALEAHWVNGKKNDVIVLIGSSEFPSIDWVSVMAWTDIEEFKIMLRDRIYEMQTLEDTDTLVNTIVDQIKLPPSKGGFERKPMAELTYLAGDVRLPWWSQTGLVLIAALVAWLVSWALENNTIKNRQKEK